MPNREELDRLIEAALADNKLTAKEMEVLIKKAKQLGIDEDEFLIELDAHKYKLKKAKQSRFWNFIIEQKKILLIILGVVSLILIIYLPLKNNSKSSKLRRCVKEKKLEYSDWKEAIIHYNFENAYSLISCYKTNDIYAGRYLKEIIGTISEAEVNYLFSEGYIARGLAVAAENRVESSYEAEYGITTEELDIIIKNNYTLLINKDKYKEAFQLLKLIQFQKIPDMTLEWYSYVHDEYNKEANLYNGYINELLNELINDDVKDFDYKDLLEMFNPTVNQSKDYILKKETYHILDPKLQPGDQPKYIPKTGMVKKYKYSLSDSPKEEAKNKLKVKGIY